MGKHKGFNISRLIGVPVQVQPGYHYLSLIIGNQLQRSTSIQLTINFKGITGAVDEMSQPMNKIEAKSTGGVG